MRSVESSALALLRSIDEAAARQSGGSIDARAPTEVAIYVLNEKRDSLTAIEQNRRVALRISASTALNPPDFEIQVRADGGLDRDEEAEAARPAPQAIADPIDDDIADEVEDEEEVEDAEEARETKSESADSDDRRRRRRGRRGGRRRRGEENGAEEGAEAQPSAPDERPISAALEERGAKRRRRRRGRGRRPFEVDGGEWLDFVSGDLKHLSPRTQPERGSGNRRANAAGLNGAAEDEADHAHENADAGEHDAPIHEAPALTLVAETREAPEAPEIAESQTDDHVEALRASAEPESMPDAVSASEASEQNETYEPDQASRDKFFSRLARWSKK
jgi:ribonuclease E